MKKHVKLMSLMLMIFFFFEILPTNITFSTEVESDKKEIYQALESEVNGNSEYEETQKNEEVFLEETPEEYDLTRSSKEKMSKSLSWLSSIKDSNNLWGSGETQLFYTSEVNRIKSLFDEEIDIKFQSLLEDIGEDYDSLSRSLAYNDENYRNEIITKLENAQNTDGGFGNQEGYSSSVWDTLVICKNLIKYKPDLREVIDKGIVFILNSQNSDEGWSFVIGETSDVYLTSEVILLFYDYMENYNLNSKVLIEASQTASNYIIKNKDSEDFWGLEEINFKASIEAFKALIKTKGIASEEDFIEKLIDLQQDNGSYFNNIYTTTLAIEALSQIDILTSDEITEINFEGYKSINSDSIPVYDGFTRVYINPIYKLHDTEKVYLNVYIEMENGKTILTKEQNGKYYFDLENNLAGNYKVIAQVKTYDSGKVTASKESEFIVDKYLKIVNGYTYNDPVRVFVGSNENISNNLRLNYKCNFDAEIEVKTTVIKDKSDSNDKDDSKDILSGKISLDHENTDVRYQLIKYSLNTDSKGYYLFSNSLNFDGEEIFKDEVRLNIIEKPEKYTPKVSSNISKQWLLPKGDETQIDFNIFGGDNTQDNQNIDLMILLDNSPSMDYGGMMKYSKLAAKKVIGMLGEDDRVGIITYARYAKCITSEYSDGIEREDDCGLVSDKNIANKALDDLKYRESYTGIGNGIQEAISRFQKDKSNNRKCILIIGDGDENVISDFSIVTGYAKEAYEKYDIEINTLAIGYKDDLNIGNLREIAQAGNGECRQLQDVENMDESTKEFLITELMKDLCSKFLNLTARDIKFVAKLNEEYMSCIDPNNDSEEIVDNEKYLYWQLGDLKPNENKNVCLKFVGENMPDNSKLKLVDEAYFEYIDREGTRQRINIEVPELWVSDYNFIDNISLDKPEYYPLENVQISGIGKSISEKEGTYKVIYDITDKNGTILKTLDEKDILFRKNNEYSYEYTWNTEKYSAGEYYFNVKYYSGDTFICKNSKEIILNKDGQISLSVFSDKGEYKANDIVELTTFIKNTSNNYIEKDLKLNVVVEDLDGNAIWSHNNIDIPELNILSSYKYNENFNIGQASVGEYKVKAEILQNSEVIKTEECKFNVLNSLEEGSGLIGDISIDKHELNVDEELNIDYNITNKGNAQVNNKKVHIEIIDELGNIKDTLVSENMSIDINNTISNTLLWNKNLEGGLYAVCLYIDLENSDGSVKKVLLDSEIFKVNTPCKVLIEERNEWSQWVESNTIYPQFRITNVYNTDLDLSKFKIRYYYTSEGASEDKFICDWATKGRQNVEGNIITIPNSNKRILEISFKEDSGVLKPGETIEIQNRILKQSWNDSFSQLDDYSFNTDSQGFKEWKQVTAYFNESKVWGIVPEEY